MLPPHCLQFQPITTGASPNYDIIFGMAFCKYRVSSVLLCPEPGDHSTQRVSTHKLWGLRRRCKHKCFALRAAPVNYESSFRSLGLR
jgi:hypothetical protein